MQQRRCKENFALLRHQRPPFRKTRQGVTDHVNMRPHVSFSVKYRVLNAATHPANPGILSIEGIPVHTPIRWLRTYKGKRVHCSLIASRGADRVRNAMVRSARSIGKEVNS